MYWAVAGFGDSSGLFQQKADAVVPWGLALTIVTQFLGPFAILAWGYYKAEVSDNVFGFSKWDYQYGSYGHGISNITQNMLGFSFLSLFLLNGLYVIDADRSQTEKLINMCRIVQKKFKADSVQVDIEEPHELWLWIGAVMNSCCFISCSVCMVYLFIVAENPKDVAVELAFLDEKWDADMMGE